MFVIHRLYFYTYMPKFRQSENLFFCGDNVLAMQWLIENGYEGRIDLCYTDPPFATGDTFSIDASGRASHVSRSRNAVEAYSDTLQGSDFIEFLRERAVLIHRLLSERGSLYLHTDYKIGHYVKVMLDEVFGIENFRSDIARIKCNPKNFSRVGYGNQKDMILFYTKGENPIWECPNIEQTEDEINAIYNKVDSDGRRYASISLHAPGETKNGNTAKPFKGVLPPEGRHWRTSVEELERLDREGLIEWSKTGNPRRKEYADDHPTRKVQDVWTFKDPQRPIYPTQKNAQMLDFIVRNSSSKGSIVLDCFAGSGETLRAAFENGRNFIGIDKSETSQKVIKSRIFADKMIYKYEKIDF